MQVLTGEYRSSSQSQTCIYNNEEENENLKLIKQDDVDDTEKQWSKEIQGYLLDILGASVWQSYPNTFAYRWRGEDTLTWGDLGTWLQVEWIRKCFKGFLVDDFIGQYNILKEIIDKAKYNNIEQLYEFRNSNKIINYLQSHSVLTTFLEESYYHLLKHFETNAKFILEVVTDPEAEHEHLMVYINTSLPINEALERLDKFDYEWFLDQVNWIEDLINFNLEIQ